MISWRPWAFFAGHRLIGSRVGEYYREFLRLRSATPVALEELAQSRLRALLRHAADQVPYYRKRVGPGARTLSDFPILSKLDLVRHFQEMMSPGLAQEYARGRPAPGYSWTEVKTGGTSGVPTTLIHDRDFRDRGRASRLFSQYLCGFPLGTPFFMLWGSMEDINSLRQSFPKRVLNGLMNQQVLNAFRMDENRMRSYLDQINRSRIGHLMAYVDAAEQLARFAQTTGLKLRGLDSVMACAGTVTPDARERIHRAFSARVHNKYGSRDCSDMACECERGKLHWYSHHVWLEGVDDQGRPVPPGETGRLLVTLLGNRSFPLVRYDIGDMGSLSPVRCRCGMPFPILERLEGRALEFVTDMTGARVTPVYIRHLIGVVHNPDNRLQCFQLNQFGRGRYELLLQMPQADQERYHRETCPLIQRDLEAVLGRGAQLEIHFRKRIAESGSGKFLYVRNLTRARAYPES